MSATKTLETFIEENPTFWQDVDGYTFDDATGYTNTGISEDEIALIMDEFGDRYIFDDDKFARRFRNILNMTAMRFYDLERIDFTSFDPLVSEYIEQRKKTDGSRTRIMTGERDKTGSNQLSGSTTFTETPGVVETEKRKFTPGVQDTTVNTETPGVTETQINGNRHFEKAMPMSDSYSGAGMGSDGLPITSDWTNPSGQSQDKATSVLSKSGSNNTANVTSHSGFNQDDIERRKSGSDVRLDVRAQNGASSEHSSESGSINVSEGNDTKVQETGRHGLTPQDALRSAVSFLKTKSAWEWRKWELAILFKAPSYNPDNFWMYL